MKRLFILLSILLPTAVVPAMADDDRPVAFEQLPDAAQKFVKACFSDAKVSLVTAERGLWPTYSVIFTDGAKIEFASSGEWTEIDCKYSHVPGDVLLPSIAAFLRKHHPDAFVTKIERERHGYELKLDNHLEVNFDPSGRFRKYDD